MAQKRFKCIVTGKEKYFPPSTLKSRLRKFGTESEFEKYYVSPPARKLIKSGLSVSETRDQLGSGSDMPEVDLEILIKLKLVKTTTRKGVKEQKEALERQRYLNSKEFRDKKRQARERVENMSFKDWVIEMTGGPQRCQRQYGGTCLRPDIFVNNDRSCDGCECYDHCLCYSKRLSHEKKIKSLKR